MSPLDHRDFDFAAHERRAQELRQQALDDIAAGLAAWLRRWLPPLRAAVASRGRDSAPTRGAGCTA